MLKRTEVSSFNYDASKFFLGNGAFLRRCLGTIAGGSKFEYFFDCAVNLLGEFCLLCVMKRVGRLFSFIFVFFVEVELGVVDGHLFPVSELLLHFLLHSLDHLFLLLVYLPDQQDRLGLAPLLPRNFASLLAFLSQTCEIVVQTPLSLLFEEVALISLFFGLLSSLENRGREASGPNGGGVFER